MRREGTRLLVLGAGSLLALFGFCACSKSVGKEDALKRLTPDDNGRKISVLTDDLIEVALPETPTSGYVWVVHRIDADYLALEGEDYAPRSKPAKPVMGAREKKIFVFRALKKGETKLELWLRRPWEPPDDHIEAFEAVFDIRSR